MLTYLDCLGLCDLTEDEIKAIAEHEHLPRLAALELGQWLVHCADGAPCIKRMIVDDIAAAEAQGNKLHALKLKLVLKHFCETHPEAQSADARATT